MDFIGAVNIVHRYIVNVPVHKSIERICVAKNDGDRFANCIATNGTRKFSVSGRSCILVCAIESDKAPFEYVDSSAAFLHLISI